MLEKVKNFSSVERIPAGTHVVVLTDADGTMIAHGDYSFEPAKPAINESVKVGIPVSMVTSKTRAEVVALRALMGLPPTPDIVENGGAICVPAGYFHDEVYSQLVAERIVEASDGVIKIEYGQPYEAVREVMKKAAKKVGVQVRGIGDMTVEEFAQDCGLPPEMARLAKIREYQEGFKVLGLKPDEVLGVQQAMKVVIEDMGFFMSVGGRYWQIMGAPAKVVATKMLLELYRIKFGSVYAVGLGDAQGDVPFLLVCDDGYLVANPKKTAADLGNLGTIRMLSEVGPEGWNKVVSDLCRGEKYIPSNGM